ncbi:DNA recombination/repair protein [Bacillus phage vB_BceH_LY2]|nr:DNA recombination/repair protein [Bacillus phage vB_BceH_LY2]
MAKKKTTPNVSVDINLEELVSKDNGIVLLRDSDYAEIKDLLPLFLPRFDKLVGGGLPFGRFIEIAGKPSGGKSTITHHVLRVASALGCICVLIDVEGTSDKKRLSALGIDTSKVLVKQPTVSMEKLLNAKEKSQFAITVEAVGETVESTLKLFKSKYPNVPVVYVWDSIGQTASNVELDKDYGDQNVGARAKALTQLVTKVSPLISSTKSMFIGINQVRDDIGGNPMFKTVKVTGGKAWEHAASVRLEVKKKTAIKKSGDHAGHVMGLKTQKSKVSTPMHEIDCYLLGETGIDYEYNLAMMAKEEGILKDNGGKSYEYTDATGEHHKKRPDAFIEWLRGEGSYVRQELLNKLIKVEYPDSPYPALNNETLSLEGWIDQIEEPVHNETPEINLDSVDEVDNVVDEILKG